MEELSNYEKQLAEQYKGNTSFDIACHITFNVMKTQEKEGEINI